MDERVSDERLAELLQQASETPAREGVELDAKTDLLALMCELEESRELLTWLSNAKGQLSLGPVVNGMTCHWYGVDGTLIRANNVMAVLEAASGVSNG